MKKSTMSVIAGVVITAGSSVSASTLTEGGTLKNINEASYLNPSLKALDQVYTEQLNTYSKDGNSIDTQVKTTDCGVGTCPPPMRHKLMSPAEWLEYLKKQLQLQAELDKDSRIETSSIEADALLASKANVHKNDGLV